jgi:hypothetical protein
MKKTANRDEKFLDNKIFPIFAEIALNNNYNTIAEYVYSPDAPSFVFFSDDLFNNEQQARINEMIRARLERQNNSFYKRYGVNDRDGLDSLIGKAQSYDIMKERYDSMSQENAQLKEKLAFMSNGINPDREDDIRAHFKGKGIEFDNDSLIKELETHPEWRKVVEAGDTTPKTTIERLGVEHRDRNVPETEAERQKRIFGV